MVVVPSIQISPLPCFNPEELVAVIMDLFPDLLAGLESHQYQLHLLCRVENTPKIGILFGQLFNVVDKTLHQSLLV